MHLNLVRNGISTEPVDLDPVLKDISIKPVGMGPVLKPMGMGPVGPHGKISESILQWTVRLLSFMALTKWMLDLVNAII